ncbi:MAG: divergent PAP2 family protein [Firmicutes bacterium]|nr:divergent PAP2 family protein [Bacillota bacterium]
MEKYKYIIVPIVTLIMCQLIKFIIESLTAKKLVWGRLFNGSGGMPSSHTSFSMSLTTMIGINLGIDSPMFAVSMIFSLITAYDAMGLRFETGKQAAAINKLLDEVFEEEGFKHLKEQLGHKPMEVLMGFVLGIVCALFFQYVIF